MEVYTKYQKQIMEDELKKIKFCKMMYWQKCQTCDSIETFRICSECKEPCCIICEINHKHKTISQVVANHRVSVPSADLEKVVVIQ